MSEDLPAPPAAFFAACEAHGPVLTPEQLELLRRYLSRLLSVNRQLNLTAVRDADTAWMRHIFDSIQAGACIKRDPGQSALDLGSGGGLPGIPLAILFPEIQWTLVDSVGKKARFLAETASELGLGNVEVLCARAEELGRSPAARGQYHLVTARAVARLPVLLEYAVPLLREKGVFYAMKGEKAMAELAESGRAVERLGVRLLRKTPTAAGGMLLVFKKHAPTPEKYPRPVGVPAKEPL